MCTLRVDKLQLVVNSWKDDKTVTVTINGLVTPSNFNAFNAIKLLMKAGRWLSNAMEKPFYIYLAYD